MRAGNRCVRATVSATVAATVGGRARACVQVAPVETSYRLARTRVKLNAQRVNKFELPFYEELVNVRAKRYQLLLDMYADVQRSAALMHDSEYCAWQRLLQPDQPCNCTAVHAGRLSFDGCQLPPVVPLPYLRYYVSSGRTGSKHHVTFPSSYSR